MAAQTLLVQDGGAAVPFFFQLADKVAVFQQGTGCLSIFLGIRKGNGIQQSDAALFVPIRIGQKIRVR